MPFLFTNAIEKHFGSFQKSKNKSSGFAEQTDILNEGYDDSIARKIFTQ